MIEATCFMTVVNIFLLSSTVVSASWQGVRSTHTLFVRQDEETARLRNIVDPLYNMWAVSKENIFLMTLYHCCKPLRPKFKYESLVTWSMNRN